MKKNTRRGPAANVMVMRNEINKLTAAFVEMMDATDKLVHLWTKSKLLRKEISKKLFKYVDKSRQVDGRAVTRDTAAVVKDIEKMAKTTGGKLVKHAPKLSRNKAAKIGALRSKTRASVNKTVAAAKSMTKAVTTVATNGRTKTRKKAASLIAQHKAKASK